MNPATLSRVEQVEPRTVRLAGGGVLLLVLLAAWFHVLKPVLGEYRNLRSLHAQTAGEAASGGVVVDAAALAALASRVEALEAEVAVRDVDDEAVLPRLIGVLADVAARHGVTLAGVRPAVGRRLPGFEELAFDVEAGGQYFALVAWLDEAGRRLEPLRVTRFDLRPAPGGDGVALQMQVATWRPAAQP